MDIWFTLAKYLSCQPPNEHLVSNPSDFDAFMSNFYRTYVRAFEWSMEQVVLVCSLPASNGLAKQHAVAWFLTELLIAVCGIKKNIFFLFFVFVSSQEFSLSVQFQILVFRLIWPCSLFLSCVILDFVVFPCCRMNEDSVLWIIGYGLQLHIDPGRDHVILIL